MENQDYLKAVDLCLKALSIRISDDQIDLPLRINFIGDLILHMLEPKNYLLYIEYLLKKDILSSQNL